ncbi:hypothetical protein ACFYKX_10255 [Cytobacillus sp. FJAT-54145]|uniref:Uncharacterized protein n=1 Tax=Cytobacillus spartinae TaxID=3299023 RepID=A0ABW6KA07_9BACI
MNGMFFPGDPRQKIACQSVCRERRNASMKKDDANRIRMALERMGFTRSTPFPHFHTHVSCHMVPGCPNMNALQQELNQAEQLLSCYIGGAIALLKQMEEKERRPKKHQVLQLVRGHYPDVYRFIERHIP